MPISTALADIKRRLKWYLTRHEALILTYHSILPSGVQLFPIPHHLSGELFESQIRHLSTSGFNCVTLNELADHIKSGKIPKHTIAITFDDGFHNNQSVALPILKQFNFPASIFIATNLMGSNKLLWPEQLAILLENTDSRTIKINNKNFSISNNREKTIAYTAIARSFSKLTAENIHHQIDDLLKQTGQTSADIYSHKLAEDLRLLSWPEVHEIQSEPLISFGSHTLNHRRLIHLSDSEAREEIEKSKTVIEKTIGPCSTFAYPHGRTNIDFSEKNKQMAVDAGYEVIVTADIGAVTNQTAITALPRISILNDHTPESFDYIVRGGTIASGLRPSTLLRGIMTGSVQTQVTH